jgi:hypothetical protein
MYKRIALAVAAVMLMTSAATAGNEVLGFQAHPRICALAQRPAGPDNWTMSLNGGADFTYEWLLIGADFTLHDILQEAEVYPFDSTFTAKAGIYHDDQMGKLFSIPAEPYFLFIVARPEGPHRWSPGFEGGVNFIVDPLYIGANYSVRDAWLDDDKNAYPWDGEFGLGVGARW